MSDFIPFLLENILYLALNLLNFSNLFCGPGYCLSWCMFWECWKVMCVLLLCVSVSIMYILVLNAVELFCTIWLFGVVESINCLTL